MADFIKEIEIRPETKEDYKETELMVRDAFWDLYKPGCDEHLVLHKLRNSATFVEELDLVACKKKEIIGNIVYSKAKIVNNAGEEFIVLCMGPLAVSPSCQKKGVGSLLLGKTITEAKLLGYKGIIIFGDPKYYNRFGFRDAKNFGIQTSDGQNFEAFMALELDENSLNGIEGKFYADSVFETDENELELFEKEFPSREKHTAKIQINH